MLKEITYRQFLEWQVYDQLEPFGEERMDLRMAAIERALWNIFRCDFQKLPQGWPLIKFLLGFGDMLQDGEAAQEPEKPKIPLWQRNKDKLWAIAHAWANPKDKTVGGPV